MYRFNYKYIYYRLFNVIRNTFIKMYTRVSKICKFKDCQFASQVVNAENHLAYVLSAVNRQMNGTTA